MMNTSATPVTAGSQQHSTTTSYQQGPVYTAESHTTNTYTTGGFPTSTTYVQGSTGGSYIAGSTGGSYVGTEIPTGSRMVTGQTIFGQERVQARRKVSSTVVGEQLLGPLPQDLPTREVEVPGGVQEVVKHIPRREIVEVEKIVPRYEYQWVDKIVEVPRVEYIDRVVEVPQYQEVVREVRKLQIVDRPYEVITEKRVPKINYVHKVRQVPGDVIQVPQPYPVKQTVEVNRYVDQKRPIVVSQTVKPYIVEGAGTVDIDLYEYEPECIPVDVHVIKAVQAKIQAGGAVSSSHKVISIPAAQYNTVLQQLNTHLPQTEQQRLPYLQENGQTTFLSERVMYTEPQVDLAVIEGFDKTNIVTQHIDHASRRVIPIPGVTDEFGNLLQQATTIGGGATTMVGGGATTMVGGGATTMVGGTTAAYPTHYYGTTVSSSPVVTTTTSHPMVTTTRHESTTTRQF